MTPATILQGVVGSHAYGLATPTSDVDVMAVEVFAAREFLGLRTPELTHVSHGPDCTAHEVSKYVALCLKANPTVTELLWLDQYTHTTSWGEELVANRSLLLSQKTVRSAYLGYATAQVEGALRGKQAARKEKYARHAWRLCHQAKGLWETGEVRVRLTEDEADKAFRFGKHASMDHYTSLLERTRQVFEKDTPLPLVADTAWADDFVTRVHLATLEVDFSTGRR